MTTKFHLDDATLMSCAAGSQPEALAAVVASHLAVCPQCSAHLRAFERIGAALFDDISPAPLASDPPIVALRASESENDIAAEPAKETADIPFPLRGKVGARLDDLHWKWLSPGIWHFPIPLSETASGDLRLLKVSPGHAMPEHGHGGSEITLILRGSYHDRLGTFRAGDVADLGDDVEHRPIADATEGCICLIATDRKAKFKGLFARLVQPLTGL